MKKPTPDGVHRRIRETSECYGKLFLSDNHICQHLCPDTVDCRSLTSRVATILKNREQKKALSAFVEDDTIMEIKKINEVSLATSKDITQRVKLLIEEGEHTYPQLLSVVSSEYGIKTCKQEVDKAFERVERDLVPGEKISTKNNKVCIERRPGRGRRKA
jgi:hypothetical protein